MNSTKNHLRDEGGSALLSVLFIVFLLVGLSTASMFISTGSSKSANQNALESSLFYVAESGINLTTLSMAADPLSLVTDLSLGFTVDATTSEYVAPLRTVTTANDKQQSFGIRVQYVDGTAPVLFADRADPVEPWTTIKVSSTAAVGNVDRQVVSWYTFGMSSPFAAAIVSDSPGMGSTAGGKGQAQTGDVVLDGAGLHYVWGGMNANGSVVKGSTNLTDGNAPGLLSGFSGSIQTHLAGTSGQIPNFTTIGSADQLFDFDRFQAVAAAGAGQVFTTLAGFYAAMNAANAAGQPLEGVIVLDIDSVAEGSNPQVKTTTIPGGINVNGTLMFRFSDGTDPFYKVVLEVPLNINKADLSALNPAVQSTYPTGYPPVYADPAKAPWVPNISPAFENFKQTDDLPALMFNNGVVDIHGATNISGVVYGPSFIEVENKNAQTQYFNGSIIGGAGVFLEGKGGGFQAVHYDKNVIDRLTTSGNKGKGLVRVGTSIRN